MRARPALARPSHPSEPYVVISPPKPSPFKLRRSRWVASAALGCALSLTGAASAQTAAEIATRRLLLDRAQVARGAGQHAEALELYQRAGQIQMTPSVRAFIAEEQLRTGRLAEAMGSADLCLRDLGAVVAVRDRAAIEAHCRGLRDDLRLRVGELVVEVPAAAGLRVTVGGAELSTVLYGQAAVTTPGTVDVVASVGGVERWRRSVTVVARETATVRVELPPEEPPTPVPVVVVQPPVVVVPPPPVVVRRPPVVVDRGRTQRTAGWALVGAAGAGVVAGTVALVVQRVRAGEFSERYTESECPTNEQCRTERAAAEAASTASWVGYVAGAALGAAGLALVLTAPRAHVTTTGLRGCGPGPGTAGVACGFVF